MLLREGSDPRTSGRFYVALVKSVLLLGSETCVATLHILRLMGSCHNWVAHWISDRMHQRMWNILWGYPPIGEALVDVGLEMIGIYFTCHQHTMDQ